MNLIFPILFVGALVVIMLGIPLLFRQAQQLAQKQGPPKALSGPISWEGTLHCLSWKAATLNQQLVFPYQIRGTYQSSNVWSTYQSKGNTGYVCFRYRQGQIEGRFSGQRCGWVVEGTLTPHTAHLMMGSPRGSFLGLAKPDVPLRFDLSNGKVRFPQGKTGGDISGNSSLSYSFDTSSGDGSLSGRLEDPRQAWYVNVEMRYHQVPIETAVLATVMMADSILSYHYD